MNRRLYCAVTGIIFIVIALLHVLRIVYHWKVVIGALTVPDGISWIALVVTGYLGYEGIRLGRSGVVL